MSFKKILNNYVDKQQELYKNAKLETTEDEVAYDSKRLKLTEFCLQQVIEQLLKLDKKIKEQNDS